MPRRKLTDAFVKSANPINSKLTEYADEKEPGLCLRVTPSGVKSWTYRYRLTSGQQKRISLGKVRDVSLADARAAVTAVYDRNEYLPEKRRALDAWAARLLEIVGEQTIADNVVSLR